MNKFRPKFLLFAVIGLAFAVLGAQAAGFDLSSVVSPDYAVALAALGGLPIVVGDVTLASQITAFEAKRAADVAQIDKLLAKAAAEGRTLDAAEKEEHDNLAAEVAELDEHLKRLKSAEARAAAAAVPVPKTGAAAGAITPQPQARGAEVPNGFVTVQPNVEKGVAFARYVKAMWRAGFNPTLALMEAEQNKDLREQTPQVIEAIRQKANVTANSAGSSGGGSNLVYNQNLQGEFIDLVRPLTILGRLPGLRRVPFNIRVGAQSSGSTGYWAGEGKPIPVSRLGTSEVTLGMAKAVGMLVTTAELMRASSPAAEILLRDDLVKTNVTFVDQQFIQPDYAAVANVSPASITNGVTPTAASGTALTNVKQDIQTLVKSFVTNGVPLSGLCWVMHANLALSISMMENAVGARQWPDLTITGGTFAGLPAIASESACQAGSVVAGEGQLLVLVNTNEILLADDGEADIQASTEASIQMLDNPTNDSVTPTATTMVSMFQTDSVALRAVRFINWAKRRANVVQYIKDAAYVAT